MRPSEQAPKLVRRDLRFTLRGTMLSFIAVGLGLFVYSTIQGSDSSGAFTVGAFTQATLAAVWFAFAFGLFAQARDLWRMFPQGAEVPTDVQWGWRYAILWRLIVPLLAAVFLALDTASQAEWIVLPERQSVFEDANAVTFTIVLLLTLIVVLSTRPIARSLPRRSWLMGIVGAAGWMAASVYLALFLFEAALIPVLTHLAILGVDHGRAARDSMFFPDSAPQHAHFFWLTLAASLVVVANFWLTFQLAKRWGSGWFVRGALLAPLIVGLVVAVSYVVWLYSGGISIISPPFEEALSWGPAHRWIVAGMLIAIVVTALTFRFITSATAAGISTYSDWIPPGRRYVHHHPILLLLLGLSMLVPEQIDYALTPNITWQEWTETIAYGLISPWFLMSLVVSIAAVQASWREFRRELNQRIFIPPLPPMPASVVWVALMVTVATGIPVAVWLGFALWFPPF